MKFYQRLRKNLNEEELENLKNFMVNRQRLLFHRKDLKIAKKTTFGAKIWLESSKLMRDYTKFVLNSLD